MSNKVQKMRDASNRIQYLQNERNSRELFLYGKAPYNKSPLCSNNVFVAILIESLFDTDFSKRR